MNLKENRQRQRRKIFHYVALGLPFFVIIGICGAIFTGSLSQTHTISTFEVIGSVILILSFVVILYIGRSTKHL